MTTSQQYREENKVDIKAGFPTVPQSAGDGHPQPINQNIPDAPPKRNPIPAAQADSRSTRATQQQPNPSMRSEQRRVQENPSQRDEPKNLELAATTAPPSSDTKDKPRLPLNVIAAYHKPLRHDPTLGVRVASLQLRSYSVRNLEFMCDFALRAAYFLGLPASGPVPLPKKIERWTMPRANFVHKKSQENFERITRRRAIQIMDGHKDVVQIWLAYLRKHQFYGVGMKADVWEFEGMDVAGTMDAQFQEVEKELDDKLSMFGWNKEVAGNQSLTEQLRKLGPGQQVGESMMHLREGSRSESRL